MTQFDVINSLPVHLRPFVAIQDYSAYTPRDQAVWRFLLSELKHNLSSTAHPVYVEGLAKTGISLEHIPSIDEMNACLSLIGWRAVVVNGFIPPIVFMEFQALKVLAIAAEMRSMAHMLYTPAPDIVHESAGHAPFIVDEDYSEFLQRFGQLGMRAIASQDDISLYEAVRHLSIVKESISANAEDLSAAEARLSDAIAAMKSPSEAALLARLQWWTIEYGLVGTLQNYRIFGAGLLSSLGESINCLDDSRVKKWPLTVNAVATPYDITCQQPQLFVARNCHHLMQVLDEFGRQMCVTRGGAYGLDCAVKSASVNTAVTNAGLEISGRFCRLLKDAVGNVTYLNTAGPTQLAYAGQQLPGHGIDYHHRGFGSPVGRLQDMHRCLSAYSVDELREHGIAVDKRVQLDFLSGIQVVGTLRKILRRQQKNIVFTFDQCQVSDLEGTVLFQPDWGLYDMAIGEQVISVYGGSADPVNYPLFAPPLEASCATRQYEEKTLQLFDCYAGVRELRESPSRDALRLVELMERSRGLQQGEWLLYYELLELAQLLNLQQQPQVEEQGRWLAAQLHQLAAGDSSEQVQLINYALRRLGLKPNRQHLD